MVDFIGRGVIVARDFASGPFGGHGEGVAIADSLAAKSRRAANRTMLWCMFVVTETDAAAIRAAFHQGGEFAAAAALRRCSLASAPLGVQQHQHVAA